MLVASIVIDLSAGMPIVSATDVRKVYDHRTVLDGVSFTIHAGERVGVVGANGSGKSTLAAILAGIAQPDSGTLALSTGPVRDPAGSVVATFTSIWRREAGRWRIVFDKGNEACPKKP